MFYRQACIAIVTSIVVGILTSSTMAHAAETDAPAKTELTLFAVEIVIGPNWDKSKAPNDQAFFKEHSANLRHLRDAGHIVMGARYSDKGLIVFSAESPDDVRAMMEEDPAMAAGTFKYEVHTFSVFYSGLIR